MKKKTYTKEAKKFLDLHWNEKLYKNDSVKCNEIWSMLGFKRYRPSLRMCKGNFGLTLVQFQKHCLVEDIKQFLSQPESKEYELIEIARKFGHDHRRYFNESFKAVTGITPRDFWFFHEHFVATTGMTLVEYQQPETKIYMSEDGKPTFLSNFLNQHIENVRNKKAFAIKTINE